MNWSETRDDFEAMIDRSKGERFGHPWNSGNASMVLNDENTPNLKETGAWIDVPGDTLQHIRDRLVLITTSGDTLHNVGRKKKFWNATGVIEVKGNGKKYRVRRGFKGGSQKPTSETGSHLGILDVIANRGENDDAVVLHPHFPHVTALTYNGIIHNKKSANDVIFSHGQEASDYAREGIGWVDWRASCDPETAQLTKEQIEMGHSYLIWDRHGPLSSGKTPDAAVGLAETVEHAAFTAQLSIPQSEWNHRPLTAEQQKELMSKLDFSVHPEVMKLLGWSND